jgi:hypothetical protein
MQCLKYYNVKLLPIFNWKQYLYHENLLFKISLNLEGADYNTLVLKSLHKPVAF